MSAAAVTFAPESVSGEAQALLHIEASLVSFLFAHLTCQMMAGCAPFAIRSCKLKPLFASAEKVCNGWPLHVAYFAIRGS